MLILFLPEYNIIDDKRSQRIMEVKSVLGFFFLL